MAEHMKENMKMIKNMDLELFVGLMEENILEIGKMVDSMEWDNTICKMTLRSVVNGSKEKEFDGLIKIIKNKMIIMLDTTNKFLKDNYFINNIILRKINYLYHLLLLINMHVIKLII